MAAVGEERGRDGDPWPSAPEAEATVRRAAYWHYPFELPWGRTDPSKPGTGDRHQQRRRHVFAPLLDAYAGSLADKRVLDLGCCQGFWSFEAARAGAASCLGLVSSPAFIDEARALRTLLNLPACGFGIAHLELDAWWVGLEPFDLTLFLGLFYHLADPTFVLRRAMALTREAVVVDTVVRPGDDPLLALVPRDPDEPTTAGSGLSSGLRAVPTVPAVVALLRDGGFGDVAVLEPRAPVPAEYLTGKRATVVGWRDGVPRERPDRVDAAAPPSRTDPRSWRRRLRRGRGG